MSKDLTIEELREITRLALDKANKDLGFVKPLLERKQFEMEPYNPEKDIKLFDFNPKEWGVAGTIRADQIDSMLENLLTVTETDPLKKMKQLFTKLQSILGPGMTEYGQVTASKVGSADLHERFAAVQLKAIIHTIFHGYQPTSAGKIFEAFVARMVGGYQANNDDNLIEDLKDAQGNYISLKTLDSGGRVAGSKLNLALSIARADKDKPGNGVIYLVCVKDIQNTPLYFKAFSFKINKKNFFNFALGTHNPSIEEMQTLKAGLLARLRGEYEQEVVVAAKQKGVIKEESDFMLLEAAKEKTPEQIAAAKAARDAAEKIKVDPTKLRDATALFATQNLGYTKESGLLSEFMYNYFRSIYEPARKKAESMKFTVQKAVQLPPKQSTEGEEKTSKEEVPQVKIENVELSFFDVLTKTNIEGDRGLFPTFGEMGGLYLPPTGKEKQFFVSPEVYLNFFKDFQKFSFNVANFARYIDPDHENRRLLALYQKGGYLNEKESNKVAKAISENSTKYKEIYKEFALDANVTKLFDFLAKFISFFEDYRRNVNKEPVVSPTAAVSAAGVQQPSTVDQAQTAVETPKVPPITHDSIINSFFESLQTDKEALDVVKGQVNVDAFAKREKDAEAARQARLKQPENLQESKTKSPETQILLTIPNCKELAATVNADLDLDYDAVVIDTGFVLETGTKEEALVKKELEDLFRCHHETRQRYIQWFGYRDPDGITGAIKSLEQEKILINNMNKPANVTVNTQQTQNPSEEDETAEMIRNWNAEIEKMSIKESKNKKSLLTDDFFNDIKKKIL